MDFNLPGLLTAPEITQWAAGIALVVAIFQQLSWIPIPEGSRTRAWAVTLLSAGVVVLTSGGIPTADLGSFVLAEVMTWASLAAASLGLNRAGTYTAQTIQEKTEAAEPSGAADTEPTTNTRGDAP
ncbi:MAG TPA: hypothetical protein VEW95_09505 [Candidatus Limnocylindrales bacterium]|nr:hypothetical protein [Candidatus Limnocylindrales bacterium]